MVLGVSGCLSEMAVELLRWGSAVLSASGRLGGVVVELLWCGLVCGPAVPSGASSLCEQLRRGLSVAEWEPALSCVAGWVIGPPPLLVVRRGSGVGTVLRGLVAG